MSENTPNIFELATRQKLQFPAVAHQALSVEQLWDLPLKSTRENASDLDTTGKILLRELRQQNEESLIDAPSGASTVVQLKLEIVKHIIAVKQAENAAKLQEAARASERATLRQLLTEKHADELKNLSKEDIEKRLKELGG